MFIQLGKATMELSEKGLITGITYGQKSVFPEGCRSWLIRLFKNREPVEIKEVIQEGELLIYRLGDLGHTVSVRVGEKEGYTVFEVTECPGYFDFLTVGPIVTTLKDVVGDVIGVVQGKDAAFGIQALNMKTLPGIPDELADYAIYVNPDATSSVTVCNFDCSLATAFEMPFGSVLHLFCENRRRDRIKTVLYAKDSIPAPAMNREDGDIQGAKFALFACGAAAALEMIGRIEIGEGLPHPVLEGEWLKTSRKATSSYMIGAFGVQNIGKMTEYALKGGFTYLYHPEPFDTWGHFGLRKDLFPDGDASLKQCADYAKSHGVGLGLHTLTGFIKTNDAYVTPVLDKRLKTMVPAKLIADVSDMQTEIAVDRPAGFEYASTLHCFRIEEELLQYAKCEGTDTGKVVLKGCTRGAFGTSASTHKAGCGVYKLVDHPYRTFFPDLALQDELADRIGELFNATGVKQISFDGQEGCEWTGEGRYAEIRFAMRCYEKFDHEEAA